MTNSLWIKPTDALDSSFIGIATLHVSGSLSAHHQEFLAVHRHWYILCSFDDSCYQFDDRLLYIYIYSTNIPLIMIINRIYETQNLLSL